MTSLSTGSRVREYQLHNVLGRGSQGTVFKATNTRNGQLVVVKIVYLSGMDTNSRNDAKNEVRILSKLNHPNVVKYFDSFLHDDVMCIIMELCDKGALCDRIKKVKDSRKLLSERVIWRYLCQITAGLKHIHEHNILHRDIKTMNIFVDANDDLKIGDLGVARLLSTKSNFANTMVGTPYYLSPELCEGKQYNAKSDMWALGCVLYEMCTLRHPFEAGNHGALILKILRGNYPDVPGHLSANVSHVISVCLSHDPDKRPTADQLLNMTPLLDKVKEYNIKVPAVGHQSGGTATSLLAVQTGRRQLATTTQNVVLEESRGNSSHALGQGQGSSAISGQQSAQPSVGGGIGGRVAVAPVHRVATPSALHARRTKGLAAGSQASKAGGSSKASTPANADTRRRGAGNGGFLGGVGRQRPPTSAGFVSRASAQTNAAVGTVSGGLGQPAASGNRSGVLKARKPPPVHQGVGSSSALVLNGKPLHQQHGSSGILKGSPVRKLAGKLQVAQSEASAVESLPDKVVPSVRKLPRRGDSDDFRLLDVDVQPRASHGGQQQSAPQSQKKPQIDSQVQIADGQTDAALKVEADVTSLKSQDMESNVEDAVPAKAGTIVAWSSPQAEKDSKSAPSVGFAGVEGNINQMNDEDEDDSVVEDIDESVSSDIEDDTSLFVRQPCIGGPVLPAMGEGSVTVSDSYGQSTDRAVGQAEGDNSFRADSITDRAAQCFAQGQSAVGLFDRSGSCASVMTESGVDMALEDVDGTDGVTPSSGGDDPDAVPSLGGGHFAAEPGNGWGWEAQGESVGWRLMTVGESNVPSDGIVATQQSQSKDLVGHLAAGAADLPPAEDMVPLEEVQEQSTASSEPHSDVGGSVSPPVSLMRSLSTGSVQASEERLQFLEDAAEEAREELEARLDRQQFEQLHAYLCEEDDTGLEVEGEVAVPLIRDATLVQGMAQLIYLEAEVLRCRQFLGTDNLA